MAADLTLPYLHEEITNDEAEARLNASGDDQDGTFLVRQRGADFVLTVRFKGRATHHLISKGENGVLKINRKVIVETQTLSDLIDKLRDEIAGWPVRLVSEVVAPTETSTDAEPTDIQVPLHAHMTNPDAGALLTDATDGTYLIRQWQNSKTEWVLSVVFKSKATHHKMQTNAGGIITINGKKWTTARSLEGLVAALSSENLPNKWPVRLSNPIFPKPETAPKNRPDPKPIITKPTTPKTPDTQQQPEPNKTLKQPKSKAEPPNKQPENKVEPPKQPEPKPEPPKQPEIKIEPAKQPEPKAEPPKQPPKRPETAKPEVKRPVTSKEPEQKQSHTQPAVPNTTSNTPRTPTREQKELLELQQQHGQLLLQQKEQAAVQSPTEKAGYQTWHDDSDGGVIGFKKKQPMVSAEAAKAEIAALQKRIAELQKIVNASSKRYKSHADILRSLQLRKNSPTPSHTPITPPVQINKQKWARPSQNTKELPQEIEIVKPASYPSHRRSIHHEGNVPSVLSFVAKLDPYKAATLKNTEKQNDESAQNKRNMEKKEVLTEKLPPQVKDTSENNKQPKVGKTWKRVNGAWKFTA
eukprot:m.55688 g.55688  ORF g.55688 m.55688 type:complete len:582 (+) comp10997_c0_seq1:46-1791(+)